MLAELFTNKIFLSGLLAGLIAQFIKMIVISMENKRFMPYAYFELAGMPSSHTAVSVSILSAIYLEEGITALFIVGLALALYVITDILTVERNVGRHAERIDKLVKLLKLDHNYKPLRTRWGHTFPEVIAGFILGLVITVLIYK